MQSKLLQHKCIQLNEYETAPYFIQFSQNLTCECLLISVFCPNLPELNLKFFCSDVQNNFRFSPSKFGAKHRNKQTITRQVLAELNKIWSCLIFIKLYDICTSAYAKTFQKLSSSPLLYVRNSRTPTFISFWDFFRGYKLLFFQYKFSINETCHHSL